MPKKWIVEIKLPRMGGKPRWEQSILLDYTEAKKEIEHFESLGYKVRMVEVDAESGSGIPCKVVVRNPNGTQQASADSVETIPEPSADGNRSPSLVGKAKPSGPGNRLR